LAISPSDQIGLGPFGTAYLAHNFPFDFVYGITKGFIVAYVKAIFYGRKIIRIHDACNAPIVVNGNVLVRISV
jgi:hypothetical protein